MNKLFDWVLAAITVWGLVFLTSCTKDGDTIYQTDPEDQASTAPLVTVIYDPNALGDRGYNDLIYKKVTYLAFTDQYAINLSNGQLSGWDFQWHNPSKHFILAINYLNY